jgi:alpha-tubulin suppressor-like RCC1 family protein
VKKIFGILFALVLVVSLGVAAASPVLADVSPGWTNIHQVAAGPASQHTVGLKSDGTVAAVGFNSFGQCDVGGWTGIVQVSAGGIHTVGVESDSTVIAAGDNGYGQCNVGGWTGINQTAAGVRHTVGLKSDGTVVAVGWNDDGQCNVGGWTDIIQVSAGGIHTVGLKSDGTVVAAGDNGFGQCNVGIWTNIIQVSTGGYHTVGLKSDGTVAANGYNSFGQCNVGSWTDIIQVSAGGYHTVGLKSDGTVIALGWNDDQQCDVNGWTGINWTAGGTHHTVGLKSDGTVVAVGENQLGQCGHIVTETVADRGTVDAIDEADTEVVATGTARVTVFRYPANPGGDPPTDFNALDKYIDVYIPDPSGVTEIEIRLYYTDAELAAADIDEESLRLFWWNDTAWVQCSDSGVNTASTNGYSGYMWAKVRNDTTPSLADLQGDEFGGYGGPSEPPDGCGCFIATAAYGTDTAKEIDILREFRDTVLLANNLGAEFVSFYYRTSPPIADFVSQHEVLRTAVRAGFVDPTVKILAWTHDLWSGTES